jgi:cell division protein FtsW (lipid II flippase)
VAVTYTRAAERERNMVRALGWRPGAGDLALVAASVAAVTLIAAAYFGRATLAGREWSARETPAINLNTVADAAALEPALAAAFESPVDRQFAARELFGYLARADGGRRVLPNVGAIAWADVPLAAIERNPRLVRYTERLRAARERAATARVDPPRSLPLLTGAEIADVKPSLVVRTTGQFRGAVALWAVLYIAAFHAVSLIWRLRGVGGDRVLLAGAHLLTAIGFAAMIGRADPLQDTMLFVRFAQGVIAATMVMAVVSLVNFRTAALRDFSFVPLGAALCLSLVLIAFGSGPAGSNAKVNLGPVQPIEAIRLLIVLFLAGYFARRWELLRSVRSDSVRGRALPPWLNLPRLEYLLPVVLGLALALALFFLQRDLGPALVISVVFLAIYAIARGALVMTLAGLLLLAGGLYVGYQLGLSTTLADRVRMWHSPWDNAARGGDQVAQALWAMATGGLWGTGLGLGDSRYLPAGHTDLILAAVAEELGLAGLMAVGLIYVVIVWRALATARAAANAPAGSWSSGAVDRDDYAFFLALGLTLLLAVPVLLMAAGMLGLVPLTGVVTPFLSYGGSAMLANFAALGALAAIRSGATAPADLQPFRRPLAWTAGALTLAAVALAFVLVRVQVVRADEIAVRPHLGVQADGSRRYQYNQRVLDVVRRIPRGRVLDRRGLPLAVEQAADARHARPDYQRLGISLDAACPDGSRCYPLAGRAYHLIGDARTHVNWTASNTAFVERDFESRLRGFDDHETTIRTVDADGSPTWVVRRDYRELVPVLRHRHRTSHPAVRALFERPRDVRLTIDAALQVRTAQILAEHARESRSGRAAAVVLDADSGALLASVSYPWPADGGAVTPARPASGSGSATAEDPNADVSEGPILSDVLLDRARFGLYPPGSTFKLLTAAAALRHDPGLAGAAFMCARLPDGRVGARVAGWGRPVRDDVLDRRPHGRVDMHRALVVSCNAYFAQLAVRLGPDLLLETARRAEISAARANTAAAVRDALPQVGYGQGEVVATPLRMARVAAAIATGGALRDVRIDAAAPTGKPQPLIAPDAARLLARYMRDAVTEGTGRALRSSVVPVAGKTGTAEVARAPSHSWFVGFAPYGPASRRVAVAVIVENAGYGAAAAVPAAGAIIKAAAELGLAR